MHLPDAHHYNLPIDVLSSALSGAMEQVTKEYNLATDAVETQAMSKLCSMMLTRHMHVSAAAPSDASKRPFDLLDDMDLDAEPNPPIRPRHSSMIGGLGDAWQAAIPASEGDVNEEVAYSIEW